MFKTQLKEANEYIVSVAVAMTKAREYTECLC